jgi:hypothetical protein
MGTAPKSSVSLPQVYFRGEDDGDVGGVQSR